MTNETTDDTTTPAPRRTIPIDGALASLRGSMAALRVGQALNSAQYFDILGALECLAEAISQAQTAERATHPLRVVTTDTSAKGRAEAAYDTWAAAVRDMRRDGPTMLEIWQSVVRAVDASKPSNPPTNEPADHWIAWRGSASDFVTDMKAVIPPAKLDFLKACLGAQDPEFARVHMTPVDKLRAIAGLVKLLPAGDYPSLWMSTPEAFALVSALPRAEIGVSVSVTGRSLHYASAHVDGLQIRASYVGPSEPPAMTAPESAS